MNTFVPGTSTPQGGVRRRPLRFLFPFLSLAIAAPGVAQDLEEEGIARGAVPAAAAVEDLDGGALQLRELTEGRPAVVQFWATWCPVCRALEPRVRAAHDRFGDDVAFVVVAVGVAQTPAQVRQHIARHQTPGEVVWDGQGEAVRAYEAPGTGFVVVLDADGRVAYTGTGVDQDLEAVLARVVTSGSSP